MGTPVLGGFPVIATVIPGELEAALVRAFDIRRFDVPKGATGFRAEFNDARLHHVGLSYCSRTTSEIGFPAADFARHLICLGGSANLNVAGKDVPLTSAVSCTISAGVGLSTRSNDALELLAVRIDSGELERKLAALVGRRPMHPLQFQIATDAERPEMQSLRRLVMFTASELESAAAILPAPVIVEIEQALIVAFLSCTRHEFSDLLIRPPPRLAPWQVRLVEAYVEANWNQPMTVEALSAETGASVRAIFNSFKKSRGYTPMAFLKQVRLRHANEMLRAPDAGASVTSVAFACCFSNVGHFARDYRAAFSELPSQTLARARIPLLPPDAGELTRRLSGRGGR